MVGDQQPACDADGLSRATPLAAYAEPIVALCTSHPPRLCVATALLGPRPDVSMPRHGPITLPVVHCAPLVPKSGDKTGDKAVENLSAGWLNACWLGTFTYLVRSINVCRDSPVSGHKV